jgi:hypothetical protein
MFGHVERDPARGQLEQYPIGLNQRRHCEEPQRGDEAIQNSEHLPPDCFATLAMTDQSIRNLL